jgi:hypothetical protein
MKNITITLDEQTAEWARGHAAEQGKSLSQYVGDVLRRDMPRAQAYERAMNSFLSRERTHALTRPGDRLPSRDEIHDRGMLRRR